MEEAEHALWRAAGLSIHPRDAEVGWPRVHASFDYHRALRFEDEFEVWIRIVAIEERDHPLHLPAVAGRDADRDRPLDDRLRQPAAERADARRSTFPPRSGRVSRWRRRAATRAAAVSTATLLPTEETLEREALGRGRGERLGELLAPAPRARTASTRASSTRRACELDDAASSRATSRGCRSRRKAELDGRPGGEPALGHGAHRAARALHALLPDLLHDRAGRCAGSTPTRAGSGCSSAGRPCTAPRAWARATASSFRSRSGPSSASGRRSTPAGRSGLHCVPGGGMSSQLRLALIESLAVDGRVLHAHLRAAPRSRWPASEGVRLSREQRARR